MWDLELPDITDVHLHPRDVGAAIVALDVCDPPEGWRWGGPEWEGRAPADVVAGGVTGATLRSPDPAALAERWASLLGRPASEDGTIALDLGGELRFVAGDEEGIEAFHVALPSRRGEALEVGGVRFEVALEDERAADEAEPDDEEARRREQQPAAEDPPAAAVGLEEARARTPRSSRARASRRRPRA